MSKPLTFIGTVFSLYGLILAAMSNPDFGIFITLILGIAVLFTGLFYQKIKILTAKGFLKFLKIAVIALLCAEALFVSFIAFYGQNDNINYEEDALIVLGAGIRGEIVSLPLSRRLDKAIEYHNKNPEAVIIVTGGMGYGETVTEAYAMEKYLISHGIRGDMILKEEKATSTAENFRFSKEILDEYFKGDYKAAIVTNNFHILRAETTAHASGLKSVSHIHAGLEWYNLVPCYLRESAALLKMLILG